jgi:hypothetical protein
VTHWYINRRWVTLVRSWYAWELQIGPFVMQWVHPERRKMDARRLHLWRDPYF